MGVLVCFDGAPEARQQNIVEGHPLNLVRAICSDGTGANDNRDEEFAGRNGAFKGLGEASFEFAESVLWLPSTGMERYVRVGFECIQLVA
jgi:hypothetical protein